MASKEFTILVREIELIKTELRNLFAILMELKVIKVKTDQNGNLVYDKGKDEQPEVQ